MLCGALATPGFAQSSGPIADSVITNDAPTILPDWISAHGQFTEVTQFHPQFASPYRGVNSLDPGNRLDEAIDLTLFGGIRLAPGTEFYFNPVVEQGFGLSNTTGIAGYVNGQAGKVGAADPYVRMQRTFLRQIFGLSVDTRPIESDLNQFAEDVPVDNVTLTVGKFAVVDIFDANSYAHDPRADFLNWAIIDSGAFDYAADAWGYTYGLAAEWKQDWWTLRGGVFDLSRYPNGRQLEREFQQYSLIGEAEERHIWFGHDGKFKLLGFGNNGKMGAYGDALRLAAAGTIVPDTSLVRHQTWRTGGAFNFEQELADNIGFFFRASANDGSKEVYEYTEINRSMAGGLSMKGVAWVRADDTVGIAGIDNQLSNEARQYFAAGGIGVLIGDGKLPRYRDETIFETYYAASLLPHFTLTLDYQYVANPAYNPDRGPVSIIGIRLNIQA